jgi:hypothetical protein
MKVRNIKHKNKELKINVDHGRVVTTLHIIKYTHHILFSILIADLGG